MYYPLPKELTIKKSKTHGLGLFAMAFISLGTNLGMTHLHFNEQLIRTPLGGFINPLNYNRSGCIFLLYALRARDAFNRERRFRIFVG